MLGQRYARFQLIPSAYYHRFKLKVYKKPFSTRLDQLKQNLTIPNVLSSTRLFILSPLLYYSIINYSPSTSLAILTAAAATDALDGYIARRYGQFSPLGSVLDPAADKALMTGAVIASLQQSLMHPIVGGVILARDVLLTVGVAVVRWRGLDDKSRFFDISYKSVQVDPPLVSKINTVVQVVFVWGCVGGFNGIWIDVLGGVVLCSTVWSGLVYAWDYRRYFRIIKDIAKYNLDTGWV